MKSEKALKAKLSKLQKEMQDSEKARKKAYASGLRGLSNFYKQAILVTKVEIFTLKWVLNEK